MNNFKEIDDAMSDFFGSAVPGVSAGSASPNFGGVTTTLAQYPAERSAATDSTSSVAVNNLYANGLLFTAFNFESRVSTSLRDFRMEQQKTFSSGIRDIVSGSISGLFGGSGISQPIAKDAIATILMPRSQTDVDITSHKFNTLGDSLITSGGGTAKGAISHIASHALFGAVESITNGYLADHGEQLQVASRSVYDGPENRVKTFMWTLTPRTIYDLIEIIKINEIFTYLSYGKTGARSSHTKGLKQAVDKWYRETILEPNTPDGADLNGSVFSQVTDFLTNVLVVSNPTIWTVENFGSNNVLESRTPIFGPAQIQSVRFDKSPNGNFNGLAIAPNLPNSFVLEVTMTEIVALSRDTIFTNSVGGI